MDWWGWVIIAVAVIALVAVLLLAVQARRRRGGVIQGSPDGSGAGRGGRTGGSGS
jgi:hypothetical protein